MSIDVVPCQIKAAKLHQKYGQKHRFLHYFHWKYLPISSNGPIFAKLEQMLTDI